MSDWDILIPLSAIIFGSLIFLIPIAALSLRFAAKPLVEALRSWRQSQGIEGEHLSVVEERIGYLEQRVEVLEDSVGRLDEAKEFDQRLQRAEPARLTAEAERPE